MFRFIILICLFGSLNALSCICEKSRCRNINASNCLAGLTLDMCHCCEVCAKAEGEVCGGNFDEQGKCGLGLKCQKPETNDYYEWLRLEGVCVQEKDYIVPKINTFNDI